MSSGICAATHGQCPVTVVQLGKELVEVLLDTGSVLSLVRAELARKKGWEITPGAVKLFSGISQSFSLSGSVNLRVQIVQFVWKINLGVVEDLVYPAILGTDFMVKTGLMVDISQKEFF